MWNVKTNVIPVIAGANGTISKSFRKYVRNIPGKHEVKELQKTAILGTAHTLRKVLIQSNLGSRTPRITNNSVYEQIFRTQNVSDDVLCLELRTRKPSKRRQKQITLDNFLVRQRPNGSEAQSSGAKRQKKRKRIPFQTITFHFLTTLHLRRQLSSIQVR